MIPHEPELRAWLRRSRIDESEADEIVQEAYHRLAALPEVDHIDHPRAYFFSIGRNLLVRRLRRAEVVSLETIAEIETADTAPDPEATVTAKLMRERLRSMIDELPERCGRILKLRKLQGYSQKEIAAMLGITESIVENQVQYGIRCLMRSWAEAEAEVADRWNAHRKGSHGQ
ncbi:MAG TPA: sigma-70 family RNA polymerase sigma factor [Sphingomicrobium sp.]|nr:sigma-70 family RNA polymerase sigma factor [Sphingomicrobium sp.]